MADFRLVMLSDLHLSATHPFFFHNWEVALEAANRLNPDLAIVAGDLSLNGPASPDDLSFGAAEIQRLNAPSKLILPGNHDIGTSPAVLGAEQPMTPERRDSYLDRVGADFWFFDQDGWRFVGLNPFLFESGHPSEDAQRAFVRQALAHPGPIGVFSHLPFFTEDPQAQDGTTTAAVRPKPRAEYLRLFQAADVRFIASGHLHCHKEFAALGIRHIWAPATAFMASTAKAGAWGGAPWVGFLEFRFSGGDVVVVPHEPDDMLNIDTRNWARSVRHRYFELANRPYRAPSSVIGRSAERGRQTPAAPLTASGAAKPCDGRAQVDAEPCLHVIEGPVGAGKTTYAKGLAESLRSPPLVLDAWMAALFRDDRPEADLWPWYRVRKERCIRQIWSVAKGMLDLGQNAIVELGLLTEDDRRVFLEPIQDQGYAVRLHVLDASREERWRRVQRRNAEQGATFSVVVAEPVFAMASDLWEPITDAERAVWTVVEITA